MKLLLLAACLPSCSTVIYDGAGQKLAVIYSDARDVTLTRSAGGEITFAATAIDNSTPGKVGASVVRGALAAWVTAAAIGQSDDTINAFTGNHLKR